MKGNLKFMRMVSISSIILVAMFLTGCGGGGGGDTTVGGDEESTAGISYTGVTSPAVIDDGNAKALSTGAYQGGQIGAATGLSAIQTATSEHIGRPRTLKVAQALEDSLRRVDLMSRSGGVFLGAIYTVSDTVDGDCGGSGSYTISVDDQTGEFSGNFAYSSYCNEGVIISGDASFSGQLDINTGDLLTFTFSFDNLTSTSGADSFTLDGTISFDVTGSTATLTMTMLLRDNNTGKVYWLKDCTMALTEGEDYERFEISGYYYDPDYGYIVISTPTSFVIYDGYEWPSEGVLVVTGDTGVAGDNTMARLTVLSSTTYQVEADTNGDGDYDWNSGVLYWSDDTEDATNLPAAPTNLHWSLISYQYSGGLLVSASVNLKWSHDLVNVIGFKIERRVGVGTYSQVGTASDTSYTDIVTVTDRYAPTYYWRVRAYNSAGDSDYSNVASFDFSTVVTPTTYYIPTTTFYTPPTTFYTPTTTFYMPPTTFYMPPTTVYTPP